MPEIYSRQSSTGGGVTAERVTYTDGSGYWIHSGNTGFWSGTFTGPAPVSASAAAVSTGVNPTETSYSLYGHVIPLSLGKVRIGGEIIAGPWVENGLATFCISFGVPADPYDTRTLKEIAFDSEVMWENGSFNTEPFTFRFSPGTLTQAADPIEIAHFGADAVAYRPQMLLWFENLPLANTKFGKIPYVAAVIVDSTDGEVNLGFAFETLAYSPWVNFTPDDFEAVDVTDGVSNGGMIIAQDAAFLSLIQQFSRFYRNWNILQTDKLRIVDRGAHVEPDIILDKSTLVGEITFTRAETTEVPRVLELSTIDPDADYTIVPSKAVRPREPVNVSASVATEAVFLPVVMDSATRQSLVTYTKYREELARKRVSITAMMRGLEIEPGDFIGLTQLGADFEDTSFQVLETTHGANYSVEITAEAYMNCEISNADPYWDYVVLLVSFNGADSSTTFTDESPHMHGNALVYGNAQVDTSEFKFGTGSGMFDGTADTLTFHDSDDWQLDSEQFTIECWIRPSAIGGTQFIVAHWSVLNLISFVLYQSGSQLAWNVSTTGYDNFNDLLGGTLVADTWTAVCVDFDGVTYRLYQDGVMVDSSTTLRNIQYTAATLSIGASAAPTSDFPYTGRIDELRISKGIARYASNGGYAVSTTAFPRTGA